MNKKLLAIVLTMFFTISFVPITVRGSRTIDLPYNYYCYWDIEAGDLDSVFWNFKSTGNKIVVYLMSSQDYQKYQLWPSRLLLEGLGELLAGYSYKASGQFNPTYKDTWYFVFFNGGIMEEEATVTVNVSNLFGIRIIIPTVIISIIVFLSFLLIMRFYPEKEKEKEKNNIEAQAPIIQTPPATIQVQQPPPLEEESDMRLIICRKCGKEVKDRNAKFCANCGREF